MLKDSVGDSSTPTSVEYELNAQILNSGWTTRPDSNRVLCPKHKDAV